MIKQFYFQQFNLALVNKVKCYQVEPLAWWVECLLMVRKTGVQSQVESYQRLKENFFKNVTCRLA